VKRITFFPRNCWSVTDLPFMSSSATSGAEGGACAAKAGVANTVAANAGAMRVASNMTYYSTNRAEPQVWVQR
jgi:hypothetical protein